MARGALAGLGEGDVVARVLGGDRAAFGELVRRYHGPLLRLALAFVRDRALAEEIVQDTWLGVLDSLAGFEGRAASSPGCPRDSARSSRCGISRRWVPRRPVISSASP